MNAGRIEQIGLPREVYDHPASRFVAEFIGAPPELPQGTEVGRPWVGALFETLSLVPGEPGVARADGIAVTGGVEIVEDLGADSSIHLALPDERTLVTRLGVGAALAEGETVTVRAPERSLRCFDAEGRSLPTAGEDRAARRAHG